MAVVAGDYDPSVQNADEVAKTLGADLDNGLTSQEVSRRLAQDGPNELRSAPRRPAWRRALSHFHDPLVYLLLAAVAIALVAWVIEGMFTCFTARSDITSAFTHLFVNPWLWGAIALSVLLQVAVVNLAFLNLAFATVPLTFEQWMVCAAMASVVLWFSELRKLATRVLGRKHDTEGAL